MVIDCMLQIEFSLKNAGIFLKFPSETAETFM